MQYEGKLIQYRGNMKVNSYNIMAMGRLTHTIYWQYESKLIQYNGNVKVNSYNILAI